MSKTKFIPNSEDLPIKSLADAGPIPVIPIDVDPMDPGSQDPRVPVGSSAWGNFAVNAINSVVTQLVFIATDGNIIINP